MKTPISLENSSHISMYQWRQEGEYSIDIQVSTQKRKYKLITCAVPENSPFLPFLIKDITKTVRSVLEYKEQQKLNPKGMINLFSKLTDKCLLKNTILKYLKAGGTLEKLECDAIVIRCLEYEGLELLQLFLDHKANTNCIEINYYDEKKAKPRTLNTTLQHWAYIKGRKDIVQYLIEKDPTQIDSRSHILIDNEREFLSLLQIAIRQKDFEMIQFLLKQGARSRSELMDAIEQKNIELCVVFLAHDQQLDKNELFDFFIKYKVLDQSLWKLFLQYGAKISSKDFDWIIENQYFELLKICVEGGGQPGARELSSALKIHSLEMFSYLVDHGVTPTKENVYFAVARNSCAVLRYLLFDQKIIPEKDSFRTALYHKHRDIPALLLKAGLKIDGHELKSIFETFAEKEDLFPILQQMSEIDHLFLNEEQENLVLQAWGKQKEIENTQDFIQDYTTKREINTLLGHRFGIDIEYFAESGLGGSFKEKTSGISKKNGHNLNIGKILSVSVNQYLKDKPESRSLFSAEIFNDLYEAKKFTLEEAKGALQKLKNNAIVVLECDWPQHTAYLVLYKNVVCAVNRGAYRQEGLPAGIQFYSFEDPSVLTEEMLLKMQASPEFCQNSEVRKEFGLKVDPLGVIPTEEQPGGFCGWTNAKLTLRLLLALARIVSNFEGSDEELLLQIKEQYQNTGGVYKEWSRFDRQEAVREALQFFEGHPHVVPDLPVLLFVLANLPGSCDSLLKFLQKQNLKYEHFCHLDKRTRNLLFHLSGEENFKAVQTLLHAVSNKQERLLELMNLPSNTPLLSHLFKRKFKLVQCMMEVGARFSKKDLNLIYLTQIKVKNTEYIEAWKDFSVSFTEKDCFDKTGLHYAITLKATYIFTYFIEKKFQDFITSSEELEEYLLMAEEHNFSEGVKLLKDKQVSN